MHFVSFLFTRSHHSLQLLNAWQLAFDCFVNHDWSKRQPRPPLLKFQGQKGTEPCYFSKKAKQSISFNGASSLAIRTYIPPPSCCWSTNLMRPGVQAGVAGHIMERGQDQMIWWSSPRQTDGTPVPWNNPPRKSSPVSYIFAKPWVPLEIDKIH